MSARRDGPRPIGGFPGGPPYRPAGEHEDPPTPPDAHPAPAEVQPATGEADAEPGPADRQPGWARGEPGSTDAHPTDAEAPGSASDAPEASISIAEPDAGGVEDDPISLVTQSGPDGPTPLTTSDQDAPHDPPGTHDPGARREPPEAHNPDAPDAPRATIAGPAAERPHPPVGAPARETGSRAVFLGRLEARLKRGIPENPVHRPPPRLDAVPPVVNLTVDPDDLLGTFERACALATTVVHRVANRADLAAAVLRVVETEGVTRAVITAEDVTADVAAELEQLHVRVAPYEPESGARAHHGVTGCVGAVAATGSVVLDSSVAGGRGASLLPRVHLCLVWRDQIVPTISEVLRPLTGHPERLPSNLVVVSGPSRTGDIEQLITLGVHGPTRVHIGVMERSYRNPSMDAMEL